MAPKKSSRKLPAPKTFEKIPGIPELPGPSATFVESRKHLGVKVTRTQKVRVEAELSEYARKITALKARVWYVLRLSSTYY